jgi:hypothetical protein
MKSITFFTIHQAPHNTFTFHSLENSFFLNVFYYQQKLKNYGWEINDFFYEKNEKKGIIEHIKWALKSDLVVISGWHNYKYILLILLMLLFNRRFAIYLDVDINSLRQYKLIKKNILKITPIIFVTGLYGESFIKRYLHKKNVFNFPYGVKSFDMEIVNKINEERISAIRKGERIRVFISNRFIERKGYHLIRSLLNYLKKENIIENFQFIIAGNGLLFDQEKELISAITKNIIFLGWINYLEYRNNMINCDVYLHCSDFEPYGIPPVDAFLCKKEIILTKKVYSKYDILNLGGKVFDFDYRKSFELHSIFRYIANNRSLVYASNKNVKNNNEEFLFANIHIETINKILF